MRKLTALLVMLLSTVWSAAADSSTIKATVHLTGATKLSAADQRQITDEVERQVRDMTHPASLEQTATEIAERVRMALQKRGYFKALLGTPKVSVTSKGTEPQSVDVTIEVHEGNHYRLKDITFSSAKAFPDSELRSQFPLESGDIFDTEKVRLGLDRLRKLYGAHGYVNLTPVPDTKIDDDARLILLQIDMDEGQVFHFGKLIVRGEESVAGARDRLLAAWRPYEGSVFEGQVPPGFLREIGWAPGVDPTEVFDVSIDGQNASVNLFVTLARLPDFSSLSIRK
jgi:outer membrane protein insertion porin family